MDIETTDSVPQADGHSHDNTNREKVCPIAFEEHMDRILSLTLYSGLGGCEGTYKALTAMAEWFRVGQDGSTPYPVYVPTGREVDESFDRLDAKRQEYKSQVEQAFLENLTEDQLGPAN